MEPVAVLAIILIVIGVIVLAYGGFSFTTREKVAEVGPLNIEKNKTRSVPRRRFGGVYGAGRRSRSARVARRA